MVGMTERKEKISAATAQNDDRGRVVCSPDSHSNDDCLQEPCDAVSQKEARIETGTLESLDVDLDRGHRCGFPEAIFGEGKSAGQLLEIAQQQRSKGLPVFVTRIEESHAERLAEKYPNRWNRLARTLYIPPEQPEGSLTGMVPVLSAGTTDLPVVEEVLETLHWMRVGSRTIMDVGVAGPHRLPARVHELRGADAVVVVAGMEGALPSIVAGHVDCPVVAVPTSVGYGANLGGISALLSMLNSCAANVSVVNIDAGFKGAYVAGMIATRANRRKE